jgi:hypothetical protein
MDNRFKTRPDGSVTEQNRQPCYDNGAPVLLGDVVFDMQEHGKIMGPYVVNSISATPIGIITSLKPMPIIGPQAGITMEDTSSLRRATKQDILTIEAKWSSENAIKKAAQLKARGYRIARIWHSRGHEIFVIDTGGAKLTHIPIQRFTERIQSEYQVLDWSDIKDITEDEDTLKDIRAIDIPDDAAYDMRDLVLDDKGTLEALSEYLKGEYDLSQQVIDTLCESAVRLSNQD